MHMQKIYVHAYAWKCAHMQVTTHLHERERLCVYKIYIGVQVSGVYLACVQAVRLCAFIM